MQIVYYPVPLTSDLLRNLYELRRLRCRTNNILAIVKVRLRMFFDLHLGISMGDAA